MLLFYDRVGIALQLDFRVASENIGAFQISGKSSRSLELFSERDREGTDRRITDSNLREYYEAH